MILSNLMHDAGHILCGVDHSEQSLKAASAAAELAHKCKSDLILLTVVRASHTAQADIAKYLRHEHNPDPPAVVVAELAQSELCLLTDSIRRGSGVAVACEVLVGEASTEIVSYARNHAIDLIVVGHCGHNRFAEMVLGSVTRRVVELAPCPVLIVR